MNRRVLTSRGEGGAIDAGRLHSLNSPSFFVGISAARKLYVRPFSGEIQNPDLAVLTTVAFMSPRQHNKTLWTVAAMPALLLVRLTPRAKGRTPAFTDQLGYTADRMPDVTGSSVKTTCGHPSERQSLTSCTSALFGLITTIKEHPLWQQ
jgi:hypothetical protein